MEKQYTDGALKASALPYYDTETSWLGGCSGGVYTGLYKFPNALLAYRYPVIAQWSTGVQRVLQPV